MDAKVEPLPSAIRDQVERLRASASFNGSDRLMALLDYLVGETLAGRGGHLREAMIGNAVYQREPPYDPRIDSTVRVEARRLRRKLDDHFAAEGQYDPVVISIPSGTYTPVFETNMLDQPASADGSSSRRGIFRSGAGTRVAILPMRVTSGTAATRHFADELTDEMVFALGSEPGLRVPSRATTLAYADHQPSISALAAELGLDAVIQGTVRENDESIRVTIEIADPKGFVSSSDRFDGALHDRSDLAERIATTLASRLRFDSSRMRARQVSPAPPAIEYHAKIYRGRQLLDRQTPEGLREALHLFKEVAESVPDYARGHSGVADCYCDMFRIGMMDPATALSLSLPAAEQALSIDPESPEGHSALATIKAWLERDRTGAEASFETALSIGRNARSARLYGTYLALFEMADEAERLFFEARTIEPLSQQQDIAEAISRFQARRFDWLVDSDMKVEARNAPAEALFYMALSAHFGGRRPIGDYGASLSRARTTHPQLIFASAELDAWGGSTAAAVRALEVGNQRASSFAHATLACSIGDPDRVFTHLSAALDKRELPTVWIRTDVRFDFVRLRPEFVSLRDRLETLRVERH